MSGKKTEHLRLHQWESGDDFLREEFNENFTRLDSAVKNAEVNAAGALADGLKAQTAALNTYKTSNDKAVAVLSTAAAAIPKIVMGSYVGTGEKGAEHPNTLTFGFQPKMVILVTDYAGTNTQGTILLAGQECSAGIGVGSSSSICLKLTVSWPPNGVSWYTTNDQPNHQLNTKGTVYRYLALG